jgi:hypothetical protein
VCMCICVCFCMVNHIEANSVIYECLFGYACRMGLKSDVRQLI